MKKIFLLSIFCFLFYCVPTYVMAQLSETDSTAIIQTHSVIEDIAHTLIPQSKGGVIANSIITAVGALLPLVLHWFRKRKKQN